MRFIPKRTKVKMEFYNNVTLGDLIVAVLFAATTILIGVSNIPYRIYIALAWLSIGIVLLLPTEDGVRTYKSIGILFKFFAYSKHYNNHKVTGSTKGKDISEIIPYVGIDSEIYINFKEYYGEVIEIMPLEFGLLTEDKQNNMIKTFSNALRRLGQNQSGSLIKINKAMVLDDFINYEDEKNEMVATMMEEKHMTESEVETRELVFQGRVDLLQQYNKTENKIYKDYFYIIVYDTNKEELNTTIEGMMNDLSRSATPLRSKMVQGKELAVFMRSTYGKEFDERDLDLIPREEYCNWTIPKNVDFRVNSTVVDGQAYANFMLTDYPLQVGNAWGYPFFSMDRTRVCVNFSPVEKLKAEKQIDNSIIEMELKLNKSMKSSATIEAQTHLETLRNLLRDLKNSNEALYNVNTFITCEAPARKEVRAILKQNGFRFSELFGRQVDAFLTTNLSRLDTFPQNYRGIQTTSVAAIFPFISGALQDSKGFYLGYNEYPVFVDFFQRSNDRVNSNIMIIGKSGSGKSFATKTLVTNLAADNARIFVLDPENEYTTIAKNLGGKVIDVGSSVNGIINPFHIMTSLKEDEGEADDSYAQHLQFLEQFFKVVFEGMDTDAFEKLNSMCVELYKSKGITKNTRLDKLKPTDYPIFDDLMDLVHKELKTSTDEYHRKNMLVIETYLQKFATGGRNSNLWNGPTSIETEENFVTFNFISLLANRNQMIADAQMLLVFKYLDNEIIKNKEFNDQNMGSNAYYRRKIIVAVDEAHVFINPKHPIALDFMANMAKRIRKYDGMQIIITQNIKDFVGSPEIARQSSAVINACQYSIIFSLAPNDMTDLVELYRSAGQINEGEQDSIVTAGLGQCFLITSPLFRTSIVIEALPIVRALFENKNK